MDYEQIPIHTLTNLLATTTNETLKRLIEDVIARRLNTELART